MFTGDTRGLFYIVMVTVCAANPVICAKIKFMHLNFDVVLQISKFNIQSLCEIVKMGIFYTLKSESTLWLGFT